nr:AraC family transcriptional regulator [Variovorax sp. PCZ-1]
MRVVDYRCSASPGQKPFTEMHSGYSISYVRKGSFGYNSRGVSHELVAGSVLLGYPQDEFMCTHDHHVCGDECLAFHLSPGFVDLIENDRRLWQTGSLPPLPELMVLGELAQAAADGRSDIGLDEAGIWLAARMAQVASPRKSNASITTSQERKRAVEAAMWIHTHSHENLALKHVARQVGLSAFHFLRMFSRVIGVTPHQYLVRSRLARAARLLAQDEQTVTHIALDVGFADLSNFVRTFGRAAGISPQAFRRLRPADRKIFQDRISAMLDDARLINSFSRKPSCTTTSASASKISHRASSSTKLS